MNQRYLGSSADLNFINDEPAPRDELNAHGRVAKAMVEVILKHERIKSIGLLGGWGSGKSTVVKLMQGELEAQASGPSVHCFTYDAWLHQSDPPRRSFLEALVSFLNARSGFEDLRAEGTAWKTKLDALNKQTETTETTTTPTLTKSGVWMLFTILFLPLGIRLLGTGTLEYDLQDDPASVFTFVLGWTLSTAPIWVALIIYLFWRPWGERLNREFFTRHKDPYSDQSILSVVANKQVERKLEFKARTPEPTAIEFQDAFREIIAKAQTPNRRLVIVIDNLDRLPPGEGMTIWATIRSFFLGADGGARPLPQHLLPTVVVPIDESSVGKMCGGSNDDHLSRSFIEKTFDLVFHVPTPVLSRWRQYLHQRLRDVFGAHMPPDWPHVVGTVYEWHLSQEKGKATPRTINMFVNSVATIWMQRLEDPVHIGLVAYFVVRRQAIADDIYSELGAENDILNSFDANWRNAAAALHFGVGLADAAELFMESPIRESIGARNAEAFRTLASTPGFESYYLKTLDRALIGTESVSATSAALLLNSLNRGDEPWLPDAWRRLRQLLVKNIENHDFLPADSEGIDLVVGSAPSADRLAFLKAAASALSGTPTNLLRRDDGASVSAYAASFMRSARDAGLDAFEIRLPGEAEDYVLVLAQQIPSEIMIGIQPGKGSLDDITRYITENLRDTSTIERMARATVSLAKLDKPGLDWTLILAVAAENLNSGDHKSVEATASMLTSLLSLKTALEETLGNLRDQGALRNGFGVAWGGDNDHPIADLAALLWKAAGDLDPPDEKSWSERMVELPELPRLVDEGLRAMHVTVELGELMLRARDRPRQTALYQSIAVRRLDVDHSFLPQSSVLIADFDGFNQLIPAEQRATFWARASAQQGFWQELEALPISQAAPILHSILASDLNKSAVAKSLQKILRNVSDDTWQEAITTGSEPMGLVSALDQLNRTTVTIGERIGSQLRSQIGNLLGTADKGLRRRWFALAGRLTPTGQKTLFKVLRGAIASGTSVSDLGQLLKIGGATLLSNADFAGAPEGAVLHIVLPMLDSDNGRQWLLDNHQEVRKWVDGADHSTRMSVREILRGQHDAGTLVSGELLSTLI